MFIIKLYKKSFFFIFLLLISVNAIAQSGIFFQAIARDNYTNPAKDLKIHVQSSLIQSSPTGTKVLIEEHQTYTDAFGIFNIMVGNGSRVGGSATGLSMIDWAKGPYYLNIKIAITPISAFIGWDYTKEWIDLGTTIIGTVPFALYSVSTSGIDEKLNTSDTTKMLSVYAKSSYIDSIFHVKLNADDTIHFTKKIYIDSALLTKMNLFDTSRYPNKSYTDSALLTKLNSAGSAASLTNFPTLNQNTTGNAATATYANSANIAAIASIAGNISATSNSTLTHLPSLNSVGTISTGIWSATTIDIAHGGTGLSTAGSIGQVLTTSDAGTFTWTNISTLNGTHYLGENYGGGIVFYVYDNGKHGLIVSTEDQSTGVYWSKSSSYTTTNAVRDGVNAGMANTERIIFSQGIGNYAAQVAANYKGGGFGDWYLPSNTELNLLYAQRQLMFSIGYSNTYYWSSNENPTNNTQAWAYNFTGTGSYGLKYYNSASVRAIRAF
jgi:hypothetical protein